jgi:lipoprotein-anchoring transpeptidase ErfK/SrfK
MGSSDAPAASQRRLEHKAIRHNTSLVSMQLHAPSLVIGLAALMLGACGRHSSTTDKGKEGGAPDSSIAASEGHGDLDTQAPSGSPRLAATVLAATIFKLPNVQARRLGYVRLGGQVQRDETPTNGIGCQGSWYRVYPQGYACTDEFTTDLKLPLVLAAAKGPDLSKPLPYRYGFIRATAPQYIRIPSHAEQEKSELQLVEHLDWYREHEQEVQKALLGANDVALDVRGFPTSGAVHSPGYRASTELSLGELLGGNSSDDPVPFWLAGGRRSIPNVSGFDVPASAIFANRVRRKTGLSLVGTFNAKENDFERRFAITVDLRLIPATKIKPDTGSAFHGIELKPDVKMPLAWVIRDDAKTYKLIRGKDEVRPAETLPKRVVVPLTGEAHIKSGRRYYQTRKDNTRWLNVDDISIIASPPTWPEFAERGEKWIDISLRQQTLILYEGKRPVYTTLVSTGRDRLGDPKTSYATPQGTFRLKSKQIAAAMDSEAATLGDEGEERNASRIHSRTATTDKQTTVERLQSAERAGAKLSTDDQRRLLNIKKGRDPEYGVTERRGATGFELRDVPWIEYFASGYALHGAYWHDSFGIPRSHGCVNLSPVDARVVFLWTEPPVPSGWHGINVGTDMGEGTAVVIRE